MEEYFCRACEFFDDDVSPRVDSAARFCLVAGLLRLTLTADVTAHLRAASMVSYRVQQHFTSYLSRTYAYSHSLPIASPTWDCYFCVATCDFRWR
jgi:hypothetical protein